MLKIDLQELAFCVMYEKSTGIDLSHTPNVRLLKLTGVLFSKALSGVSCVTAIFKNVRKLHPLEGFRILIKVEGKAHDTLD